MNELGRAIAHPISRSRRSGLLTPERMPRLRRPIDISSFTASCRASVEDPGTDRLCSRTRESARTAPATSRHWRTVSATDATACSVGARSGSPTSCSRIATTYGMVTPRRPITASSATAATFRLRSTRSATGSSFPAGLCRRLAGSHSPVRSCGLAVRERSAARTPQLASASERGDPDMRPWHPSMAPHTGQGPASCGGGPSTPRAPNSLHADARWASPLSARLSAFPPQDETRPPPFERISA